MVKKTSIHPYSDRQGFDRLMLLVATLVNYPGVGCRDYEQTQLQGKHHNALQAVTTQLQDFAKVIGIDLPPNYPAAPTLRKDLELLRDYQILEHRMYRWGYYLGTGAMTKAEFKAAFNALESQAKYQADPQIRKIYVKLRQRLRGFEFREESDFFYPVRQNLNRAIDFTDPEEMMKQGKNRNTLFHQIEQLESAIIQGKKIKIYRSKDLYGDSNLGEKVVAPLQLIYYNIAWYLLYEDCQSKALVVSRLNRFQDKCELLPNERDIYTQKKSLETAYQLLENGWGLKLGSYEEQQLELQGKLNLELVRVRFFPPISDFIQEGEQRHPKQKLHFGKNERKTGKPKYIDYEIELPRRSLNEFSFWVQGYADKAQVLSPPQLVEKHRQAAIALLSRYQKK